MLFSVEKCFCWIWKFSGTSSFTPYQQETSRRCQMVKLVVKKKKSDWSVLNVTDGTFGQL